MPANSATPKLFSDAAYSSGLSKTVMVGQNTTGIFETWTWDGMNWVQVATPQVMNRQNGSISYDGTNLMVFGGEGSWNYLNDTWTFNGTTWTQQSPATSPDPRMLHGACYLQGSSGSILFGGKNYYRVYNDTWLWNGTTWSQVVAGGTANVPAGRIDIQLAASNTTVVLFGGSNGNGLYFNDTWTFNGTTWTQVNTANTVAGAPTGRAGYGLVYDSVHTQWVLFGGRDRDGVNNDTWTFNGTTWTQVFPANSPSGRYGHLMTFDASKGQTVLFGGNNNNNVLNDTWIWNGTNWTQV